MPAALLALVTACAPSGEQQHTPALDRAFVHEAVESVATVVDREYFDPDVGARVAALLRQDLANQRYDGARSLDSLARLLTRHLYAATRDKHLAVSVVAERSPTPASPVAGDDRAAGARRTNYGVQKVEVLPGNIGYLNLTSFYRPEEGEDALAAAMRLLRHADALILDMRENGGGSPDAAALLASYLFETRGLPLFDIIPRAGGSGRRYTTSDAETIERNEARPVYVLTAEGTFSAGEGFAFILQERGRAEVIGERTAGAANPGRPYPVNSRLEVTVPNGRVRTAITGSNWEGDGVVPDVAVPVGDALRVAQMRALRLLITRASAGSWRETLERRVEVLASPSER